MSAWAAWVDRPCGFEPPCGGVDQDEPADPPGRLGREPKRQRPAVQRGQDHRPVRFHRIEHGAQILLPGRPAGRRVGRQGVGGPGTPGVEEHHPGGGEEMGEEHRRDRVAPDLVDVGVGAAGDGQIDGAIAGDVVGDPGAAHMDEPGLGLARLVVADLAQDLQIGPLRLRAGFHPELIAERRAASHVGQQRGRPVARGRLCAHQQPVALLTERFQPDQLLRRGHGGDAVAAQARLGRELQRLHVEPAHPQPYRVHPRSFDTGQKRPPRDLHGQRGKLTGPRRVIGLQRGTRRHQLLLQLLEVHDRARGQPQLVAAAAAGQCGGVDPDVSQEHPNPAHHVAQRRSPGGRQGLSPQRVRQLLPSHGAAALGDKQREDQPAVIAAQARAIDQVPVGLHRQRIQQVHEQTHDTPRYLGHRRP
jgi:hypothetical protein